MKLDHRIPCLILLACLLIWACGCGHKQQVDKVYPTGALAGEAATTHALYSQYTDQMPRVPFCSPGMVNDVNCLPPPDAWKSFPTKKATKKATQKMGNYIHDYLRFRLAF